MAEFNNNKIEENCDDDGRFISKFEFWNVKNFNVNFNCQFYLHLSASEFLKILKRVVKLDGRNMQMKILPVRWWKTLPALKSWMKFLRATCWFTISIFQCEHNKFFFVRLKNVKLYLTCNKKNFFSHCRTNCWKIRLIVNFFSQWFSRLHQIPQETL